MSPLLFLVIPAVVFVVGSSLLYLASHWNRSTMHHRDAPSNLQTLAPMLKDQRDAGWPVNSGNRSRR